MRTINQDAAIISAVSIPIYLSLAATSFYYAYKFYEVVQGKVEGGKYATPKFVFFIVLGISAVLDLFTFVACSAKGGPNECLWNHESYAFVWSCHLIATCGYLYAVITPSILWSDIIQQKDGHFWNSKSPLDYTKVFFRVAFVIYCCIMFTNILGVMMYSKSSDESAYSNSSALGAINNCLTPIILVVITFGCLYSGIKLRQYVMNVQLGSAIQIRILMKLNFTMFIICASYVVRAILVMSLYNQVPADYIHAFRIVQYYPTWMVLTQWIPFVLCSFCLINEMRFQGVGKGVNTSNNGRGSTSRSSDRRAETDGHGHGQHSSHTTNPPHLTTFSERAMMGSVDSIISDIAFSETSSQCSKSDMHHSSTTQDHNKLNLLMGELERAEGGNIFDDSGSSRTMSADQIFDAPYHSPPHGNVGMDHFFTTNAMHAPPSQRNST